MRGWIEIGQMIKLDRASKNMTQEQYAEPIGVTQQTVGAWEKGRKISEDHWENILKATGMDIGEIINSGGNRVSNQRDHGTATIHQGKGHIRMPAPDLSPALQHLVDLLQAHDKDGHLTNKFVMEVIQITQQK